MWVAPNSMARSRFDSTGSMAMTRLAPAIFAPWTALMPMPPTPMTATLSPGLVPARSVAEPKPVATPHDTSATASKGRSFSTFTSEFSLTSIVLGERAELGETTDGLAAPLILWASRPSLIMPMSKSLAPSSQRYWRPVEHHLHRPQLGMNETDTWSPGSTLVTPGPTSSTTPAPSWPPMTGAPGAGRR